MDFLLDNAFAAGCGLLGPRQRKVADEMKEEEEKWEEGMNEGVHP